MSVPAELLKQPLWVFSEEDELSEDECIFYNLMLNLEAYGTPVPCLYELPPKGENDNAL